MTRKRYVIKYPYSHSYKGHRAALGQKIVSFKLVRVTVPRQSFLGEVVPRHRVNFVWAIELEDGRLLVPEAFSQTDPAQPIDALFRFDVTPAEAFED